MISKGTKVITPKGRIGTVRSVNKIVTGRPGRPAIVANVQERGVSGKLLKGVKEYRAKDLKVA